MIVTPKADSQINNLLIDQTPPGPVCVSEWDPQYCCVVTHLYIYTSELSCP